MVYWRVINSMGKRGKENFAPTRRELFSLFKELKPISDEKLKALKYGQSKGKIKKIERLVSNYNEGLKAGYTGLKLSLITNRPGAIDPQEYKNNLIFQTARKHSKKFVILWESGKYTNGYVTLEDAKKAIDTVLDNDGRDNNNNNNIKIYSRKVLTIDWQGAGYIYVACNESLPDMVKIGMTTTSVAQRLKELSNTSVPTAFYPIAIFKVSKSVLAIEQEIHHVFKRDRIHAQREFFRTDEPIKYCKKIKDYLVGVLGDAIEVTMFPNFIETKSLDT